jgi:hypothetical protein
VIIYQKVLIKVFHLYFCVILYIQISRLITTMYKITTMCNAKMSIHIKNSKRHGLISLQRMRRNHLVTLLHLV